MSRLLATVALLGLGAGSLLGGAMRWRGRR